MFGIFRVRYRAGAPAKTRHGPKRRNKAAHCGTKRPGPFIPASGRTLKNRYYYGEEGVGEGEGGE